MLSRIPASLVLPLRYEQDEIEIFMGLRKTPAYYGLWIPPGGKADAGESPEDTACRELYEETRAKTTREQMLKVAEGPVENPAQEVCYELSIWILNAVDLTLINNSPGEHRAMTWIPVQKVIERHLARSKKNKAMTTTGILNFLEQIQTQRGQAIEKIADSVRV